jgi:hypothetical protein
MKKLGICLLLAVMTLVACDGGENSAPAFTEDEAVPFEIVKYEEKIAPVYGSLVPYIAYAETEGQLKELQGRFQVDDFTMDMDQYFAVFIVTYSDSCGIAVEGMYEHEGTLAAKLQPVEGNACKEDGIPHTFVLQVEKQDYNKVQLYNGNIIKSSIDVD